MGFTYYLMGKYNDAIDHLHNALAYKSDATFTGELLRAALEASAATSFAPMAGPPQL